MSLVIFHNHDSRGQSLVRTALADPFLAAALCHALGRNQPGGHARVQFAAPYAWALPPHSSRGSLYAYDSEIPVHRLRPQRIANHRWWVVVNGRYPARCNHRLLDELLREADSDVILVQALADFQAYQEHLRITASNQVAGFRRHYADRIQRAPMPQDWPHLLFLRTNAWRKAPGKSALPTSFHDFLHVCERRGLPVESFRAAGDVLDLESEQGMLQLLDGLDHYRPQRRPRRRRLGHLAPAPSESRIHPTARIVGPVIIGNDVVIERNAVVVGPAFISHRVHVGADALVQHAILARGQRVPENTRLQHRALLPGRIPAFTQSPTRDEMPRTQWLHDERERIRQRYRSWPLWSYPRAGKRLADIIVALVTLALFAPVLPLLALAVKLSSPGPVFHRGRRQGRYGREFHCLKFRSMVTGADDLQELLRTDNEVDGPQFKMEDDPRVTRVGAFLRDTYLDELPQLFNVLAGHMSIVGPRPSPESENILCPWWRDARLSVRPGITGLWQAYRTREAGRDFQEWILYDTRYVQQLSWRTDLRVCWQTARLFALRFAHKL